MKRLLRPGRCDRVPSRRTHSSEGHIPTRRVTDIPRAPASLGPSPRPARGGPCSAGSRLLPLAPRLRSCRSVSLSNTSSRVVPAGRLLTRRLRLPPAAVRRGAASCSSAAREARRRPTFQRRPDLDARAPPVRRSDPAPVQETQAESAAWGRPRPHEAFSAGSVGGASSPQSAWGAVGCGRRRDRRRHDRADSPLDGCGRRAETASRASGSAAASFRPFRPFRRPRGDRWPSRLTA